jgi:arylsulfatase A-like enzyme
VKRVQPQNGPREKRDEEQHGLPLALEAHRRSFYWREAVAGKLGRSLRALASIGVAVATLVACSRPSAPSLEPSSFLLFVLDTTRFDAVSANGAVTDTTPTVDALAASGLRYTRAYANASWTLPSHASLFTGLLASAHGVGWASTWAPDELTMLAERLRDAGYETVGFSENPWVSEQFNMAQGFERFMFLSVPLETGIADWLATRGGRRPFFLFVNVLDAHAPYNVREVNPFIPCCVSPAAVEVTPRNSQRLFCSIEGNEGDLEVQHGLYLGGVAAADAKVEVVRAMLRQARIDTSLVTIVTADHGEHFGEHGFVDHLLGVREPLIHVPLVVHGLRGIVPATIDEPVQLLDIVPTVLAWAGMRVPGELPGRVLPVRRELQLRGRTIVAEWDDPVGAEQCGEDVLERLGRYMVAAAQRRCVRGERVHGAMRAAIAYPMKLYWYERYPAELFDIGNDPGEEHNVIATEGRHAFRLLLTILKLRRLAALVPRSAPLLRGPAPEIAERLRALGYVGGGHPD